MSESQEEIDQRIRDILPTVIEVPELPDAGDVPETALGIFCMRACGMSHADIASILGCHPSNIDYYVRRYDPERRFSLPPEVMRSVVVAFARSKKVAALQHITPRKLESSSARDLIDIAIKAQRIEQVESSTGPNTNTKTFTKLIAELATDP